jgi:hypothetical protein
MSDYVMLPSNNDASQNFFNTFSSEIEEWKNAIKGKNYIPWKGYWDFMAKIHLKKEEIKKFSPKLVAAIAGLYLGTDYKRIIGKKGKRTFKVEGNNYTKYYKYKNELGEMIEEEYNFLKGSSEKRSRSWKMILYTKQKNL